MYIKRDGAGPRVFICMHGWSGNHETYAPLVPYLPPDVTLYRLDLPGHTHSPLPAHWDFDTITKEIEAGIVELDIPQFTLVGNCSGAIVGLMTALRLVERINRIVVIDPFAYMPWYLRVFLSKTWGWYAYVSTFANPVGRWITNNALRGKRTPETNLTDSFATIDHRVTYGYLKVFATVDSIDRFRVFTMPVDIAYGEHTFGAIKRSLPQWQRIWPYVRYREMKGAGHFPIMEATEQVAALVFETVQED